MLAFATKRFGLALLVAVVVVALGLTWLVQQFVVKARTFLNDPSALTNTATTTIATSVTRRPTLRVRGGAART